MGVVRGDVGHKGEGPSENFGPPGDETHTDASSWVLHGEGKRQTQEKEFRVRYQKAGSGQGQAWRNEDEETRHTGRNRKC